ncbi:MAG TPA: formate dehydrogenase subunit gamma [Azospirillum sp.]
MKTLRHLLLVAALLMALPAVALAQLTQQPGPNSPTSKDQVELYSPAQDQLVGRVSIPDSKLGVLVQPEGREWREFRTFWLRIIAGVLIVGMVAALALFYLMRGPIRIDHGRSGRTVPRFGGIDRFAHWTTATSFLVLALTGLAVTFGRPLLIPLFGHQVFSTLAEGSKVVHNFFSLPFVLGVLLMLVLWVRDNIPERADLVWLKSMGGLLSRSGEHPECGRFNAGQKGIFWAVVLGGGALAVTGFMLMTPFAFTGIGGMQILHVVHAVLAALLIAVIIAHIYIGSIGMEGAFDAMGSGEVDENWAKDHHRGWYEQQRKRARANDTRRADPRAAE